jgi:hypothetical protein
VVGGQLFEGCEIGTREKREKNSSKGGRKPFEKNDKNKAQSMNERI